MTKAVGKISVIQEAIRFREEYCSNIDTSSLTELKAMLRDKLNITVLEYRLDNDDDGVLIAKDDKAVIVINERQHSNRRRFTLMHEVCHLIVHHQGAKAEVFHRDERSSQGTQRVEIEANAFAAEVLMPKEEIKAWAVTVPLDSLGEDDSITEIRDKAQELGVSALALTIRLETLGLFRSSFSR